jgi:Na+-driven multidrug efflux pump
VLIQTSINSYGDIAVSGSGAANNIEGFIYVAMNAISIAAITVVSQNVGAAKFERIKRVMLVSLVMVSNVGLAIAGLVMIFNEPLLSIYAPDGDDAALAEMIKAEGLKKLIFVGCPYFLCGIMECVSGALKGMGRSLISMIVSVIGSCALRILWIYTVCPFFNDIRVLYLAYPVTWTVTSVGLGVFVIKAYRELIRARDARTSSGAESEQVKSPA